VQCLAAGRQKGPAREIPLSSWSPLARCFLASFAELLLVDAIKSVLVLNPQGSMPAPRQFVKLAGSFQCQVEIVKGNEVINAAKASSTC
jgi:hypothetical protein